MTDSTVSKIGFTGALATIGLDQLNTAIACAVGLCSLIIVLPKATKTASVNLKKFWHWVRYYNTK